MRQIMIVFVALVGLFPLGARAQLSFNIQTLGIITMQDLRAKCATAFPDLAAAQNDAYAAMKAANRKYLSSPADWKVVDDPPTGGPVLPGNPSREQCEAFTAGLATFPFDRMIELGKREEQNYDKVQRLSYGDRPHSKIGILPRQPASATDLLSGIAIAEVEIGSPAEKAGMRIGDVIQRFGDRTILILSDLQIAALETPPGTRVRVQISRNGRTQQFEIITAQAEG